MEKNKCGNRNSPEVRDRAVWVVFEHQGEFDSQSAVIKSVARKIGSGADTRRAWVRRAETDSGRRDSVTTAEREVPNGIGSKPLSARIASFGRPMRS